MLQLVYFMVFIIYNGLVFIYSKNLFATTTQKRDYNICIAIIINLLICFLASKMRMNIPEWIVMLICLLVLYVDFTVVYKAEKIKTFLITANYIINLFSIKFIIISLCNIIYNIPIYNIIDNINLMLMINIITDIVNILYIIVFFKLFSNYNVDVILSDKKNLKVSLIFVFMIFIFLICNTYLLYLKESLKFLPILIIKISIYALVSFKITMFYSFFISKLNLYAFKTENMKKEIEEDELYLKHLETEANYDYFTSCFKRDFVYEKIDKLLKDKSFFSLVFIDIDGLKTANDIYGHDEGDFYIKEVSNILNEEFVGKVIGRIGGDEFIIVLEATDMYATIKCTLRCYDKAIAIQKNFNKPYQTSLSYGIVEILPDNSFTRDEIIKIADENMYEFKRKRKKHRKN